MALRQSFVSGLFESFKKQSDARDYIRQIGFASLDSISKIGFSYGSKEFNPVLFSLIASATSEVLLQFYNYDDQSEAGLGITQALITLNNEAGKRTKPVKVMFFINHRVGLAAKLTTEYANPVLWLKRDEKGTYVEVKGEKRHLPYLNIESKLHAHHFFDSHHNKQVIIDRRIVMLFSGDVTHLTDYESNPVLRPEVALQVENEMLAAGAAESYIARFNGVELRNKFPAASRIREDGIDVVLIEKNPSTNFLKRFMHKSPYIMAVVAALNQAKESIRIMVSNLNDPDVVQAIKQAIARQVMVKIVLGKYHNQKEESYPMMGGANLAVIEDIYNSVDVKWIDYLKVRWAVTRPGVLTLDKSPESLHAKVVVVDDEIVFMGSSPLDKQETYSGESDFVISSWELAADVVQRAFNPLYKNGIDVRKACMLDYKTRICEQLKKLFTYEGISFFARPDSASITKEKQDALTKLIDGISRAKTFSMIHNLLLSAAIVSKENPLAKTRRVGILDDAAFGRTDTIIALENILTTGTRLRMGVPL